MVDRIPDRMVIAYDRRVCAAAPYNPPACGAGSHRLQGGPVPDRRPHIAAHTSIFRTPPLLTREGCKRRVSVPVLEAFGKRLIPLRHSGKRTAVHA